LCSFYNCPFFPIGSEDHHPGIEAAGRCLEGQLRRSERNSEIIEIFVLGVAEEQKVVDPKALEAGVAVQFHCEVLRLEAFNRDILSLRSMMGNHTTKLRLRETRTIAITSGCCGKGSSADSMVIDVDLDNPQPMGIGGENGCASPVAVVAVVVAVAVAVVDGSGAASVVVVGVGVNVTG